jgi:hypothetical protein
MSPTSSFAGSTGATVTRCRLRIRGTIDEPLGRNSTVAPAATLAAAASSIPMWHSVTDQPTTAHCISRRRANKANLACRSTSITFSYISAAQDVVILMYPQRQGAH